MNKPSFLTSTTAIGYLVTVVGALLFAGYTKNTDLIVKLVEMIIPSYIGVKGFQMGQKTANGGSADATPKP